MTADLDRIVQLQTAGDKKPLYCVHAVSGSAYSYVGLARLLGPTQPVFGFEAPGFDNDREPVCSLSALAAEYASILQEFAPQDEYQLLGWSLGGVLAFEMAKRLTAVGARVTSLILVDAGLPRVMDFPPERDVLRRFIQDMSGAPGRSIPYLEAIFGGLPENVRPEDVFEMAQLRQILPEEIDAEMLAHQYLVFRAHLRGFYSIQINGLFTGQTVHILAAESPAECMRWGRMTPDLSEYTIPGSHHSMWSGQSLQTMSEIISRSINR